MKQQPLSRKLRAVIAVAALATVGGCSSVYTLDYIARTLTHQDANTDDFRWKRSVEIAASATPRPLLVSAGGERAIEDAFLRLSRGEDIAGFMARTNTQSLLVVHGGQIQLQRYGADAGPDSPQAVFSVSKSILSLLVGQALAAGYLSSLDDPITRYLPELRQRDPRFDRVTLGHLLDMRSGIAFSDNLSFPFVTNDAPLIYYASDLRQVALTQTRIERDPGVFNYNDYNPNLVALALERTVGAGHIGEMRARLWDALGTEDSALWSVDSHGFPYWESGFVATSRDLAKVGQLLLQESERDESLLPSSWRSRIASAPVPPGTAEFNGRQWSYRAGWWLILRPDGKHDIAAIGRFGQMIYISPVNDVVIVRTGGDENPPEDGDLTSLFYSLSSEIGRPR